MRLRPSAETVVLATVLALGFPAPATMDATKAHAASDIITGPAAAPPQVLSKTGTACTCPAPTETRNPASAKEAPLRTPPSEIVLTEVDELAALSSIQTALTKMDDGTPYVWKRGTGLLSGVVRPTKTFRNAKGSICRHLVVLLTTGRRTQTAEGVACRLAGGRWQLEG